MVVKVLIEEDLPPRFVGVERARPPQFARGAQQWTIWGEGRSCRPDYLWKTRRRTVVVRVVSVDRAEQA